MGDGRGALVLRDLDQELRDERSGERRREWIHPLVARVRLEAREHEPPDEPVPAVHHVGLAGSRRQGALRDVVVERPAAHVHRQRDDLRFVSLAEPRDGDRGVQTAREREDDLLQARGTSTGRRSRR